MCVARSRSKRSPEQYQRSDSGLVVGRGPKSDQSFAAIILENAGDGGGLTDMSRLNGISGKEAAIAFQKAGWLVMGQVGSHLVMTKPTVRANLSIPQHRELSVGTLRALIRHAGLTVDEFIELLNK